MIPEFAVVKLKRKHPSIPFEAGVTGTVLIVHSSTPTAYEIEFTDDKEFLGTYTVEEDYLEVVQIV